MYLEDHRKSSDNDTICSLYEACTSEVALTGMDRACTSEVALTGMDRAWTSEVAYGLWDDRPPA